MKQSVLDWFPVNLAITVLEKSTVQIEAWHHFCLL